MALLEAKGIKKSFGGVTALKNGNLTCNCGKITGLLGANGSGKSTISKIISGTYKKDEGTILYDGKEINYSSPSESKRNGIAMVFQNLSLIPDLTVWQNIVLGNESKKKVFLDTENAMSISKNILNELNPGININQKVRNLNSAQQQIVEIAKALVSNPRLLFLDEPTAALEQEEVKNLFKYMRKLASKGVGMIFTSHRLGEVLEICDDIIVFRNGENVGTIDFEKEGKDKKAILSLLTGSSDFVNTKKEYRDIKDDFILELHDLKHGKELNGIDLKLRKGEVLGIGGLAGQGQTELMLALAGNYNDITQKALLDGQEIKLNKASTIVRNGIYLVPGDRQKEGLFMNCSLYQNVLYSKMGHKQPLFIPKKKYQEEARQIIKELSIKTDSIDTVVSTLSGGNQQKVVVGKWLPFNIKVLLLSDPAKGIDIAAKKELYEYIMKLVKEKNMSVILYASDNNELIDYCDRLLVMFEGKVVKELNKNEISDRNIVEASLHVKDEGGELE
jgi:ribose transport system ATP-binding protein